MANPQKEHGYTRIANEILEAVYSTKFNGTQLRILLILWRYTYGFQRKEHELSVKFICGATGLNEKGVKKELNYLIENKVILETSKPSFNATRKMEFNKNYEEWQPLNRRTKVHQGYRSTPGEQKYTSPGVQEYTTPGVQEYPSPGVQEYPQERNNKEKSKEKYKESEKEDNVPYEKIKKLFNETCEALPKIRVLSAERKKHIKARFKQYDNELAVFEELFTRTNKNPFLRGENNRSWKPDFDWLMKENNMTKILEGFYEKQWGGNNGQPSNSTSGDYAERTKKQRPQDDFIQLRPRDGRDKL